MEVILAKTAGFCFGVGRAVKEAELTAASGEGPVYSYGPLVHNEEVIKDLERRGIRTVTPEELAEIAGPGCAGEGKGTVIIRAHGIGREEQEKLSAMGFEIKDLTCPFVKRIHHIAQEASEAGRTVVITGNAAHPEVKGIIGWCSGPYVVVAGEEDLEDVPSDAPLTVISQTTFHHKKFKELVEKISERSYNINVVNTICNATQERQTEAGGIASRVDAMIVIGGKQSSNTQKLYEICRNTCPRTFYIQTPEDLKTICLEPVCSVGITAGASTPNNIIEEVYSHVRGNQRRV